MMNVLLVQLTLAPVLIPTGTTLPLTPRLKVAVLYTGQAAATVWIVAILLMILVVQVMVMLY